MHSVRVRFSQFLAHFPAVLALNSSQQSLQVASHPFSHLGTAKVRPDPHQQFSQGLRALTDAAQLSLFLTACLFCPFFGGHLLHLPEASYHIFVLTGTVVLSGASAKFKPPVADAQCQVFCEDDVACAVPTHRDACAHSNRLSPSALPPRLAPSSRSVVL